MGQALQMWRSGSGQREWLSVLIDTFEEVSETRAVPCDSHVLTALRAQLARPASFGPYATPFALRH